MKNQNVSWVECNMHIKRLTLLRDNNPSVADVIGVVIQCWQQRLDGVPEADIPWNEAAEASETVRAAAEASLAESWEAAEPVLAESWSGFWRNERDTMITLLTNVSNN